MTKDERKTSLFVTSCCFPLISVKRINVAIMSTHANVNFALGTRTNCPSQSRLHMNINNEMGTAVRQLLIYQKLSFESHNY